MVKPISQRRQNGHREPGPYCFEFSVPIYGVFVMLNVSDNIAAERLRFDHLFGPAEGVTSQVVGLCSSGPTHVFGLFFLRGSVAVTTVAHEVFHLTHRILHRSQINFDVENQEAGAYLHGYLMSAVLEKLLSKGMIVL